jgi:hypothetical protein
VFIVITLLSCSPARERRERQGQEEREKSGVGDEVKKRNTYPGADLQISSSMQRMKSKEAGMGDVLDEVLMMLSGPSDLSRWLRGILCG